MASSLPMNVVLKSKFNGKYLEYVKEEGQVHGFVRFSGEDVHSPLSKFQVERASSGDSTLVHLLCLYNGKYLVSCTQKSDYNVPVADKPEEDQSKYSCTLFQPIRVGEGDDYRFKHVNSGKYAVLWGGEPGSPHNDCLHSGSVDCHQNLCDVCTVIDSSSLGANEAKLQATEVVLYRDIYNVRFHFERARRYNEYEAVMGTGEAVNRTDKNMDVNIKVPYTESKGSIWNATVPLTPGVRTTLRTRVPIVTERDIEISAQESDSYEWGVVNSSSNTIEAQYGVNVPPMHRAVVTVVGTTATCDVPFAYTLTETYRNGTRRTSAMDNGIYTGTNSFNINQSTKNYPLN